MAFTKVVKGHNFDKTILDIKKFTSKMADAAFDELEDTAIHIRTRIVDVMNKTPRIGNMYKRGGKINYRSIAGNPPAPDSGNLRNSIKMQARKAQLEVEVGSTLEKEGKAKKPYSQYLEEGTAKIKPRPWLELSTQRELNGIENRIIKAIENIR